MRLLALLVLSLLGFHVSFGQGTLFLPAVFSDHMVLQRNKPICLWGTGEPQDTVQVALGEIAVEGMVQADGTWRVYLPAQPAGGPFELAVLCKTDTVLFKDVMIGEVWVASGQSNMAMALASTTEAQTEIDQAALPMVRMFRVINDMSGVPLVDLRGEWRRCTPQTAGAFSAVGYYFAKQLWSEQGVAVGIVDASWGGTPIEPWISRDMLLSRVETREGVLAAESANLDLGVLYRRYLDDEVAFLNAEHGVQHGVHLPDFDDAGWRKAALPLSTFSLYGDSTSVYIPGCYIWFRNTFQLNGVDVDATLRLAGAAGELQIFVNGERIQAERLPDGDLIATIPKADLQRGKNTLAIRLRSMWGEGSLGQHADSLTLTVGKNRVALGKHWTHNARVEPRYPDLPKERNNPAALYHAMIAPMIPYTIRGFLWYQGEANTWRPEDYRFLFPMLINDWRIRWEQGYLPFLFVQLPNFGGNVLAPVDDSWAFLREAQTEALQLPHTGMAVTIDIGDAEDIHPKNKKDVGLRLYDAARYVAYGASTPYSGPLYRDMEIKGQSIVLHFDHCDAGLTAKGDSLTGFEVAGEDGRFLPAEAHIDRTAVVVYHPAIEQPTAVRYGWAANPTCNLFNGAGLPASPFRTDR